jgi:hypothetical protein
MSEEISKGVWCPRCGRKDAVIVKNPLPEIPAPTNTQKGATTFEKDFRLSRSIELVHEFCGYSTSLDSYLRNEAIRSQNRVDIDIPALVNDRKLVVTNSDNDISEKITKALALTNGYFTDYLYHHNYDKIKTLICPFCHRANFTGSEDSLVCECGHYQIPAINWIYKAVEPPFFIKNSDFPSQGPFKIDIKSRLVPDSLEQPFTIAHVRYFYNDFKDQRLFIVEKTTNDLITNYLEFVIKFTAKAPLFTVIQKEQ